MKATAMPTPSVCRQGTAISASRAASDSFEAVISNPASRDAREVISRVSLDIGKLGVCVAVAEPVLSVCCI